MSNILKIVLGRSSIIPRHFATTIRTNSSSTTPVDDQPSVTNNRPFGKQPTVIAIPEDDQPISIKNPYRKAKAKCILCNLNIHPNYKNVRLLSQFQSPYTGRIYGRHITGLCQAKQKAVEHEIQKSQSAGYMPAYHKVMDYVNDPKLYDPDRPIRPHKY